jgi:hypothetical protein
VPMGLKPMRIEAGADEDFIITRMDVGIDSYCFFFYSCSNMPYM